MNIAHSLLALATQGIFLLLSGSLWIGCFIGTAYYLGREIAQAEQRVIQNYYGNKRANAPWWCGYEPRAWTKKGMLDWIVPALLTGSIAFVVGVV